MALGGGTFTSQNKSIPGTYINFVSAARAGVLLSNRGIVTMGLELDWGPEGIFQITAEDLETRSQALFGYRYDAEELSVLRDIFCNATKFIGYRLNGGGNKAENEFATALYGGTKGNEISIAIGENVDIPQKFDVKTYMGTTLVDTQTVSGANELVKNDFVSFKTDATLAATAGTRLTGGTNKDVTGEDHLSYQAAVEPYSFHAMGVMTEDEATNKLYVAFTKRMRERVGAKFQCVLYNHSADYEGVVNVKNCREAVPWVLGAIGGCAVNKSCTNKKYDGEAIIPVSYTQPQLEAAIKAGEFVMHQVGDDIRVLTDINSLTTLTDDKKEEFQSNQTIRVVDQIATDIAAVFNTKYLGKAPNNISGRNALKLDIVKHHKALMNMNAIEAFSDSDVTVEKGETKKSVVVTDAVTVVNAMEILYMTVIVA